MGNTKMSNATYTPKTSRLSFKFWAYFLSLLTVITPVAPSLAAQMSDSQIQYEFDLDPVYQRITSNDYQYETPTYIESSTPSATSIESFYERIENEHKVGLGDPTWVPISGEITFVLPVYPNYKYIGTPMVQSRYIKTQINALLGRTLIDSTDSAYQSEAAQLNTLYENAVSYIKNTPNLVFGDKLNRDQDGSGLSQNMIWPELRNINGEDVIVPIVYLTQSTIDQQRVENNQTTFNGDVSVGSLMINGVSINTGRETYIQVANSLVNNGGTIQSPGELKIVAGGIFANLSGLVQSSNGDLVIGAHSILNRTIVHRYDTGNDQGYRYGEIAEINSVSDGSVVLRSYGDIVFSGAEASSGGELIMVADGSIQIGTEVLYSASDRHAHRFSSSRSSVSYLQSSLTAEDTIRLAAQGEIKLDAAEIVSDEGHIELLAGLGITVEDELASTRSYRKGKYGRRSVEESAYQTVAIRSVLDAGKGVRLHSALGDITLQAVDISSTQGTSVTASGGAINMLMAVETDHYSYSSIKKSLWTIETVNRGHNIETAVPNTIIGGFQAEALYGLNVEYEGNPDLSFDEQVSELSQMEGMEWMDQIRNSSEYSDVNWEEVSLAYEEWNESNTSLSPAAIAVIVIIVAVCTAGAGAAAAQTIVGTTAATATTTAGAVVSAAIAAGVNSMITQFAIALANGAVNGDVSGALDDFASDETLKSLAIAMVTAAAITYVDTQFFSPNQEEILEQADAAREIASQSASDAAAALPEATAESISAAGQAAGEAAANHVIDAAYNMTLGQQAVQALTHATVTSGVEALSTGADLDEFGEIFARNALQNAVNVLGRNLTESIAGSDLSTAMEYIANASVGCFVGAATSSIGDGNVSSAEEGQQSSEESSSPESACVTAAGASIINDMVQGSFDPQTDQLTDQQRELATWLENNVSSSILGVDDQAFRTLVEIGDVNPRAIYYVTALRGVRGELANLTRNSVQMSRVLAGVTAFFVGASADNISIADGYVETVGWSEFNVNQDQIRRGLLLHDFMSEQENYRAMRGTGIYVETLINEGVVEDFVQSLGEAGFLGEPEDLQGIGAHYVNGEIVLFLESLNQLQEVIEQYSTDESTLGSVEINNLRLIAIQDGVQSALDQFAEYIELYDDTNFENEQEIRDIHQNYVEQWNVLRESTEILEWFGLQGPARNLVGRAADTADAVGAATEWAVRSKKVDDIIAGISGVSLEESFKLRRLLMENDDLLKAFELNPSLADTWKNLNAGGVGEDLLSNPALLQKLNSLPCSI